MKCIFNFALTEETECPVIPSTARVEINEFVSSVCQFCPIRLSIVVELSTETENEHKRKKK